MEKKHRTILHERFNLVLADKEIIVLGIPDDYQYMDEELVEMLEVLINPYLLV